MWWLELLWWLLTKMARSHQAAFISTRQLYITNVSSDGCLSLTYRLAGCAEGGLGGKALRPINGGISFSLNVCFLILPTDWLSHSGTVIIFFLYVLCYEKEWEESDEHFGVGSLLSFSRMCMAYVRESCCVPPSLPRTHRSRLEVWFKFAL